MNVSSDEILNIVLLILAVIVIWAILKRVLRLAARLFSCGLTLIIVGGVVWLVWSSFVGQ